MLFNDGTFKEKKRFYQVYNSLRQRCTSKKCKFYKDYGGRGIKNEWENFEQFKKDMFESYVVAFMQHGRRTQIDRIDNDGNYCKENCRWVTIKENSLNKRNTVTQKEREEHYEKNGYTDWYSWRRNEHIRAFNR